MSAAEAPDVAEVAAIVRRALAGVAPEVELDRLDPDADLQREADLDSMDFLDLVAALRAATGVDIPERDYPHLATPAGCIAYLVQRRRR
ncbi:MAG TPA: acyl carrier protein [Acidimicrobiales bacterium]